MWFWHVLALALGGRTVDELQRSMTEAEFSRWVAFHSMYPLDDFHRIHRPAAVVASAMGGKFDELLAFLAPDPRLAGMNQADVRTLRAMGFKTKGG